MFDRSRWSAAWMAAAVALAVSACTGSSSGGSSDPPKYPGLVSLSVAPADGSIPKGLQVPFTATGAFADGSTRDVTDGVAWTSSDAAIASFSTNATLAGIATASGTGLATITVSVDGLVGSTTLTVLEPAIQSVEITPNAPTILINESLGLALTATLTDGTTAAIPVVSWSSSDPTVVDVAADGTATAKALAPDGSSASATITAVEPTFGGQATTLVTVTPYRGVLSYIALTPGSIVGGGTRVVQGVVALTWAPETSTLVTLTSSDTTLAVIDPSSLVFDTSTRFLPFQVTAPLAVDRPTKITISATADTAINEGVVKTARLNVRKNNGR